MSKVHIAGVNKGKTPEYTKKIIADVFLKASNDLEWLNRGDVVLIKPALNSPDPYPATTDPLALEVIVDLIRKRGGRVLVGDQSGIEHVMQDHTGVVTGDSEKNFFAAGMGEPGQYEFVAFEKDDWTTGFHNHKPKDSDEWPDGFWITDWVEKADHIINLPRVSTHVQAGVTLGFKSLVGMLREDSRLEFHACGPFYGTMKKVIPKNGLKIDYDMHGDFWKKITEIYRAVKDKNRLTLFSGTKAQVTFGPDKKTINLFKSRVAEPETGLIFASTDPVSAEATAIAFLTYLYGQLPSRKKLLEKFSKKLNGQVQELGEQGVWDNPFLKHALSLGLGERELEFDFISNLPDDLVEKLKQLLQ